MECIICFESTTKPYKIKCGSKVAHEICHSCETTIRLQTNPTLHGRNIKCPVCRKDENGSGNRTRASYEAELRVLYSKLYPRILPFERPVVRFQQYQTPVRVTPPVRAPVPLRAPVTPTQVAPTPVATPAPTPVTPVTPAPSPVTPVTPAQVAPTPVTPAQVAASTPVRDWCSNRRLQCPTKSKTTRTCTYPMGCEHKVCRHCNMCASHFEF